MSQLPAPRTLVAVHAHPDDEAIATSGTMAKAKAAGHRIVLVVATRGELGEQPDDLAPGETLADRRTRETLASAAIIGIDRVEFLGYRDSGMEGDPRNGDADAFAAADVEEAAARLARILREEQADVLLSYDERGNYLHPDHIQVHRVGVRAAELAGTPRAYESTMNRDHIRRLMERNRDELPETPDAPDAAQMDDFGTPEDLITTTVDVRDFIDQKRAAMAAHASQIPPDSFFLSLPPDPFRDAFGYEWFIRCDARDTRETWIFDGLEAAPRGAA